MYKLVAVGGKIRGEEYILKEGENTLGREAGCDIVLNLDGISKKHLKVFVTGETAFIEDLGSSNGTFVNGKIIRKKTIENGDKIALPGIIFQVVYVHEKKVFLKKKVGQSENNLDELQESIPDDPIGKLKYYFKNKIMLFVYKINEEYEWSAIVGIFLGVFIAVNIGITIVPILKSHKDVLFEEVSRRAASYASEIGRHNARALEQKDLDRVNTAFLGNEPGVAAYELFDPDGRILRPIEKMNEYTNDPFSIQAREWAISKNPRQTYLKDLGRGEIGIAKRIRAYNTNLGYEELVGVITIRFAPKSWVTVAQSNSISYFRALAISAFVGIVLFGIYYYITAKPIEEMNHQIDLVLRGRKKELESKFLFKELNGLRGNVNSLLQRIHELSGAETDSEFEDLEDDQSYVTKMSDILDICPGAGMVLNSEKLIKRINVLAEDIIGLRETASIDESLLDVAREKGFAATVIEICDLSANEAGSSQTSHYELQGFDYKIMATALIGKDNFAKAFLITFSRDD